MYTIYNTIEGTTIFNSDNEKLFVQFVKDISLENEDDAELITNDLTAKQYIETSCDNLEFVSDLRDILGVSSMGLYKDVITIKSYTSGTECYDLDVENSDKIAEDFKGKCYVVIDSNYNQYFGVDVGGYLVKITTNKYYKNRFYFNFNYPIMDGVNITLPNWDGNNMFKYNKKGFENQIEHISKNLNKVLTYNEQFTKEKEVLVKKLLADGYVCLSGQYSSKDYYIKFGLYSEFKAEISLYEQFGETKIFTNVEPYDIVKNNNFIPFIENGIIPTYQQVIETLGGDENKSSVNLIIYDLYLPIIDRMDFDYSFKYKSYTFERKDGDFFINGIEKNRTTISDLFSVDEIIELRELFIEEIRKNNKKGE